MSTPALKGLGLTACPNSPFGHIEARLNVAPVLLLVQRVDQCIPVGLEPYPSWVLPSEIVHGEIRVPHDLPEQPSAERAPRVDGYRRAAPVAVAEDHVAPALPDWQEAVTTEDGEHLLPRQDR